MPRAVWVVLIAACAHAGPTGGSVISSPTSVGHETEATAPSGSEATPDAASVDLDVEPPPPPDPARSLDCEAFAKAEEARRRSHQGPCPFCPCACGPNGLTCAPCARCEEPGPRPPAEELQGPVAPTPPPATTP